MIARAAQGLHLCVKTKSFLFKICNEFTVYTLILACIFVECVHLFEIVDLILMMIYYAIPPYILPVSTEIIILHENNNLLTNTVLRRV